MFRSVCIPLWGASLATLLLANLGAFALLQTDMSPRRCHSCGDGNNSTAGCSELTEVLCPLEKPWCSITAATPNVTSSLGCAAVAAERACSLAYCAQKQRYQITCVCATDLCNTPFSPQLLQTFLNFASNDHSENNTTDLTDAFFNSTKYTNVTKSGLFAALNAKTNDGLTTLGMSTARTSTVRSLAEAAAGEGREAVSEAPREAASETRLPRAEALKQEAAPSDDDEDEGEGSGDEERPRRPAPAAPQGPSSYLPASENKAAPLYSQVLVTTSLFLFVKV